MLDTSARAVALDPQWLPHAYGADGSTLTSVFVPRERREQLMFLSDDHYGAEDRKAAHPVAEVAAHVDEAPAAPLHFVFHTAFCCSTLMVKALDIPGHAVGLKEPDIFIDLARRLTQRDDPANRQRLDLVLRLLARPFEAGEKVIAKPTNIAARLILPALELRPDARAVLLYSDLPTLLRSLVKRGMWGRIWARRVYSRLSPWSSLQLGYGAAELWELTDLQVAALGWLMQIHHFGEVARRLGPRVTTIDGGDFVAQPAPTLRRVADLFGLELSDTKIEEIARGPVFSRHSKLAQRDYSIDAREAEHEAAIAAHGEEIGLVVKWIEAVADHCRVPLTPAQPAAAAA